MKTFYVHVTESETKEFAALYHNKNRWVYQMLQSLQHLYCLSIGNI